MGIDSGLSSANVSDRESDERSVYLKLDTAALAAANQPPSDAPLGILLPIDKHWTVRIAAAERLRRGLVGQNPHPPSLTEQQRDRMKYALRTVDGLRQRASYQTVARQFFGRERVEAEHWKTSALKAQIARLAAHGRMLVGGGYRALLRGERPGRHTGADH